MAKRRSNQRSPGLSRRSFLTASALGTLVASPGTGEAQGAPGSEGSGGAFTASSNPGDAFWDEVRAQFIIEPGLVYMNNGSLGPVSRVVLEASGLTARQLANNPIDYRREDEREALRRRLARFVGADADEIALTRSTTEGMNIFAHGLDWRPGDQVLMCTHEHPGGYGPYQTLAGRRGIEIRWIEIPTPPRDASEILDLYRRAMTPRTRVLVVSHMTYVTGLVMPVQELATMAHEQGALISVDGAHPLGMLPLDLHALGCDHYAAAGQKWLMGGTGTGMCFIRRELQERVWPLMGHAAPGEGASGRGGASRYELTGQRNLPAVSGMAAAIELQEGIGRERIEGRVRDLAARLRYGLAQMPGVRLWTAADPGLSAGLSTFTIGQVPMHNAARAIRERSGIYVLPMPSGDLNAVRVSTHIYNRPSEVDRLLDAVRHILDNELDFA